MTRARTGAEPGVGRGGASEPPWGRRAYGSVGSVAVVEELVVVVVLTVVVVD